MKNYYVIYLLTIIFALILCANTGVAKDKRTYYDDDRLSIMHENLTKYDWARKYLRNLLEGDGEERPRSWSLQGHPFSVRRWCDRNDEFIWSLMPSTKITKAYDADKHGISPQHGTSVRKGRAALHPWNYDPFNHPYKIQDPIDGNWYPSNEFGKDDMTSGNFPDNGQGMKIKGETYFPVREYAITTYVNYVVPLLERMSKTYLMTGDKKIAHKCAILLAKVAYEYPNNADKADRCQSKPWGRLSGLVTDSIWETFKLTSLALAYDAIYDAIGEDRQLVDFLKAKGLPVKNSREVQKYIEENIFRIGMFALQEEVIVGNLGFRQETAMTLALVMDDYSDKNHPNSKEIVDWCMFGAGQMAYIMSNGLFRDGGGFESPNYNIIKLDFISAAQKLAQLRRLHPSVYPNSLYPDIFDHPKAHAMFDYFIDIIALNRFVPSIGDDGGATLTPKQKDEFWSYAIRSNDYLFAYKKYGDARYAKVYLDNKIVTGGDPFERYTGDEIVAVAKRPGAEIVERTRALDGYGVAFLHSGAGPNARSIYINYSNHFMHYQHDKLNIGLYHHYVDHLPDLGYPFTWQYPQWDSGMYTHNVVVVDETQGKFVNPYGHCNLLADEGPLHVVSAAHDPYVYDQKYNPDVPKVDLYERTIALIDVSPEEYYVVDLFVVAGGQQHDQSWHGCICPVVEPHLQWQEQTRGSFAGLEIPPFSKYKDRQGKMQNGPLSFFTNAKSATTHLPVRFDWNMGLNDVNLRLNIIPVDGPVELITTSGRSPARPPDWSIKYLFVRRTGSAGLRSRFLSIIDTRRGDTPTVKKVDVIKKAPLTVKVAHSKGTDILVLNVPLERRGPFLPREIGMALLRGKNVWHIGKQLDNDAPGYKRGKIKACDYGDNAITVEGLRDKTDLVGKYVRIFTNNRSSFYRILEVQQMTKGMLKLYLDQTALLFEADLSDFQKGRVLSSALLRAWTEKADKRGQLIPWRNWNRDASLVSEDGKNAYSILGVTEGKTIHLDPTVPANQLREKFVDTNNDGRIKAIAYDYSVDFNIEIAESGSR